MANRWTRRNYGQGYGEGDDRGEQQRMRRERYGRLEEQYGRDWNEGDFLQQGQDTFADFGTTNGPNYGSSYGRSYGQNFGRGDFTDMPRYEGRYEGERSRERGYDENYRDAARFERESHYGTDRDPEWRPYGGGMRRHERHADHDRGRHESRDYGRDLDRETNRGAWNRSRDEVSSWFGNEDAQRRRDMDEMRDDMRHREHDMQRNTRRYRDFD
jgi:hypothetical protein